MKKLLLHISQYMIPLALVLSASKVLAQDPWEKDEQGEIKDVQIEIVKDRKITFPRASRNYEKVPPRPYEEVSPVITYSFKEFKLTTPGYAPVVRPLKLKQEELSKIYGNYLSGGLGNYGSVFLEGSATTKRDKNKFLGAHLYTRSFGSGPVDDDNSASSTFEIDAFGKSMGKSVTFGGTAGYKNRGGYFYGYVPVTEVDRDKIRQTYSIVNANVELTNTRTSEFNFRVGGGYSYLQDHYRASEGELSLEFTTDFKLNETSRFLIGGDYFLITRKDSLFPGDPRHLFRVKPAYQFTAAEKLQVTFGVNIAVDNDQYAGAKSLHFYPNVSAQYDLSPTLEVYGNVTGDMDKVNLHSLSAENLWLNSNVDIFHTNRVAEIILGFKGKVGRKVAVNIGGSFATLKNYYYFLNLRDNRNPGGGTVGVPVDKFTLIYDGNTQRLNPFAELNFLHAEIFRLGLRGDYFHYATGDLQEAYHRPTYRLQVSSKYNLYEKIVLEGGFIAQGGMKAVDPAASALVNVDPAIDMNVKARYFISRQFSAFTQFENILSNKYPIFLSYPARGFQVLVGVSWSL